MTLLRSLVREELRLHAELFGARRFLAFPLVILLLVAGGVWLLVTTGIDPGAVVAGMHVLVAFLGLQVGLTGLVGRDAMQNVLGDVTLLVFSGRTLPLSWRRLLATFLLSDLLYYGGFFVTPMAVGTAIVLPGTDPFATGLLWLTLIGTFALGAGLSLTLAGLGDRYKPVVLAAVALLTAGVVFGWVDVVAFSPYGAYLDPSLVATLRGFGPAALFVVLGPLVFRPSAAGGHRARRAGRNYRSLGRRLPGTPEPALVVRPLLEVTRSSGSVWKVFVSLGLLFAVTAFLLDRVSVATSLAPAGGIAFGTLLALGTTTSYNWLTSLDDPAEYLHYPVPYRAVFGGKLRAFLLLAIPAGLVYLLAAALWYPLVDLAVGLVVFPAVSIYVFGLTAYLTGLSPNELLFDTVLFSLYGAGLALVAVPLLVASLAAGQYPVLAPALSVALALVSAGIGGLLIGRSGPRWDRRLRTADS